MGSEKNIQKLKYKPLRRYECLSGIGISIWGLFFCWVMGNNRSFKEASFIPYIQVVLGIICIAVIIYIP